MALPAESGGKTEIITLMVIHRHFDRGIMIRFLSPGMAWALAAPVAIVVLYLLRRKFLPRQVPSIFLWRRSVEDYAANRPFQKLMKNLLLPLQVLAALCISLALMNPVIPGGAAGRTIYIFDISGSMRAESGGVSRLDQARTEAVRRLREMPAEEKITIFTAGEEVRRVLLDGNREEAEAAIAATGAPDGVNLLVIKVLLEMGGTIGIVACKDEMFVKEAVVENGDKTVLFQPINGILHLFAQHAPRWSRDGYF